MLGILAHTRCYARHPSSQSMQSRHPSSQSMACWMSLAQAYPDADIPPPLYILLRCLPSQWSLNASFDGLPSFSTWEDVDAAVATASAPSAGANTSSGMGPVSSLATWVLLSDAVQAGQQGAAVVAVAPGSASSPVPFTITGLTAGVDM
jgi:hypothetical protein